MSLDPSEVQRLVDEASIRTTIARFADSAMRGDFPSFRSVWADDARFVIGEPPHGRSATGVDDIVDMLRRLRTGKVFFVQFAVPGVIEIDGDVAGVRTICHEAARGPGETFYRNHCVAFDELRRVDGRWVFTARHFRYLWLDTSPFGGSGFPLFADPAVT